MTEAPLGRSDQNRGDIDSSPILGESALGEGVADFLLEMPHVNVDPSTHTLPPPPLPTSLQLTSLRFSP